MKIYNYRVQQQFKYYTFLAMLYVTLMVTAQAVAYRVIQLGPFLEPGGIFIFPATFAINDIIAEVYGPTLARRSIFYALLAQAFYSIIPLCVNLLPYPSDWQYSDAYTVVFNSSWLVFLSNIVAVMIGMVFNTQIIGKTKLIAGGRFFSIRSFFASAIGEFILTTVIVAIALVPVVGINKGMTLFINMFIFKLFYSLIAAFPAGLLAALFKRLDNADVYEEYVSFNPWGRARNNKNNVISLVKAS